MQHESIVILITAVICLAVLLVLQRSGSKLYNRSAGVGIMLIAFPTSLAIFANFQWLLAVLLAPVGLSIWIKDLFREQEQKPTP